MASQEMDISSVESQQSKVSAHESSVELPLSLVVFPDVSITPDSGLVCPLLVESEIESAAPSAGTASADCSVMKGIRL